MTESIHQSIVNVSAGIGAIGKDKQAKIKTQSGAEFRYQFRGIDDVLDALHPVLIECGVTITPQVVDVLTISDGVLLTINYLIANIHGDTVTATFVGEGRDKGDKAAQKAQSNAYKYMAFQTFCIPVAVDDSDSNQYRRPAPTQAPTQPPAPEPAKAEPSAADKRMKAVKDAAWQHTTGTNVERIVEAKLVVEQAVAAFGGEPKNKTEVAAVVAEIDLMFVDQAPL